MSMARFFDLESTMLPKWRTLWRSAWTIPLLAGVVSATLFALTLQTHINGSSHPYATDVGEIQNALPRWGTIHFSGYPLYSITGSLIVTLLRLVGIPPAMGASLVSLLWGAAACALTAQLALMLGARRLAALLSAVIFAITTSMWVDSSLAEVHSMSMVLIAAILFFTIRFDRSGKRKDLLWLAFMFSQGIFHNQAVMGVAAAVLLLVVPRWRMIWKNIPIAIGIGLFAPLLYLYLPLREWMGSDWTFGNTSTWEGFWRMFLDIKAERFVRASVGVGDWSERLRVTFSLMDDDVPLVVHGLGLVGLFSLNRPRPVYWRYTAALLLAWVAYAVAPMIFYGGFVGDALLAIKLPVSMFTGLGLALLLSYLCNRREVVGRVALGLSVVFIALIGWRNVPDVVAVTKDRSVEEKIALADQAGNPDRPLVLMILWGHNYWGVAYAQAYRGQLEGVRLVDHNANFRQIVAEGNAIVTPSETFYLRPLGWWTDTLGEVYLDTYAPGLIEIRTMPRPMNPDARLFYVNDDLAIEGADARCTDDGYLLVTIYWQTQHIPDRDYSVAVHLVAADPPTGPQDILAQADSLNPVEGWYPTSQWQTDQVVRDMYRLVIPPGAKPVAVRVTAYYVNDVGQFINGEWLSLPIDNE